MDDFRLPTIQWETSCDKKSHASPAKQHAEQSTKLSSVRFHHQTHWIESSQFLLTFACNMTLTLALLFSHSNRNRPVPIHSPSTSSIARAPPNPHTIFPQLLHATESALLRPNAERNNQRVFRKSRRYPHSHIHMPRQWTVRTHSASARNSCIVHSLRLFRSPKKYHVRDGCE